MHYRGMFFRGMFFWPHYVGKFWSWYLQKRLRDFGVLRKLPLWWARGMRPLVRPSALGAGFLVNSGYVSCLVACRYARPESCGYVRCLVAFWYMILWKL